MRDTYIQNWNSTKEETSKLRRYTLYKQQFALEPYLSLNIPSRLRKHLARFRASSNDFVEFCGETNRTRVEDEFHVLMECPAYSESRNIYLGHVELTLFSFCTIMSSTDENQLICLANFVSTVFKIRSMLSGGTRT